MRKFASVLVLSLALAGCASSQSDSGLGAAQVSLTKPELQVWQMSQVPVAARHTTGALPVQYRLRVSNRAAEQITLRRVTIRSIGQGAYDVGPSSHPFSVKIEPDQSQEVMFWAPANIANSTLVGANGPVTVRIEAAFDSPVGQFQEISIQQVNAGTGVDGMQPQ
ncbi:MAG TPA: hypothetical protein VGF69_00710 [Thermoanaerobaculia bacterium]|jgi:hypothetical protein